MGLEVPAAADTGDVSFPGSWADCSDYNCVDRLAVSQMQVGEFRDT